MKSAIAGSLLLAMNVMGAESEPVPGPDILFQRHFQATAITSRTDVVSVKVTGTLEREGRRDAFELEMATPARARLTMKADRGRPVVVVRDEDARLWQQEGSELRDLSREAGAELMGLMTGLFPPSQRFLAERLEDALCELDTAEGRPVYAVGKKRATRRTFQRLLFDRETGLLVRAGLARFSDYRQVENIRMPFRIQQGVTSCYRVDEITLNPPVKAEAFRKRTTGGGWLSNLGPNPMQGESGENTQRSAADKLEIVRRPPAAVRPLRTVRVLPPFDPTTGRHGQVDLRSADARKAEVSGREADLMHADFDTRTIWPETLPGSFDPRHVLELGKDPGLGLRILHARGITGRGVGVATIDFPLLTEHQEYAKRLRLYEEIHSPRGMAAHMHGTAVASLAVGRTCGVAPEADLYHIATIALRRKAGKMESDYSPVADAILRLLEVNASLPLEHRIRVISISMGWSEGQGGYQEAMEAVRRAGEEKVFVISTALRATHQLRFDGLNRPALMDPNTPASFGPGSWWAEMFWNGEMRFKPGKRLCVPMDGRTTASEVGSSDYVHYDYAGWSWAVPWLAGLYALACQVDPAITPHRFWEEALKTGNTVEVRREEERAPFGTIANPQRLIESLLNQAGSKTKKAPGTKPDAS